ncbi:uncharacterized protein IL334_002081 [Kwoniella shivajii]|uniref:PIG-P domain-containing protein n=1 Tax=Kwoniella shivajii TaxID=564305 RepID=A0ABZ1CTQ3_9TREE|nr:hypothetical protein IL334_002081 [Kwoniella shivajii]
MTASTTLITPPPSPPLDPVSPLSPISPWPPIPPPSVREQPTTRSSLPNATDVYSSIAILGTYLLFFLYLLWAFAPSQSIWTSWLPDRQWAIIVPCWMMIIVLLTYWIYAALIIYNTPSWDSVDCITDPYSGIQPLGKDDVKEDNDQPYYRNVRDDKASHGAVDLPIDLVGRVLYPPRRRKL